MNFETYEVYIEIRKQGLHGWFGIHKHKIVAMSKDAAIVATICKLNAAGFETQNPTAKVIS